MHPHGQPVMAPIPGQPGMPSSGLASVPQQPGMPPVSVQPGIPPPGSGMPPPGPGMPPVTVQPGMQPPVSGQPGVPPHYSGQPGMMVPGQYAGYPYGQPSYPPPDQTGATQLQTDPSMTMSQAPSTTSQQGSFNMSGMVSALPQQMYMSQQQPVPLQGYQTQHQGAPPQQQPEQQLPQPDAPQESLISTTSRLPNSTSGSTSTTAARATASSTRCSSRESYQHHFKATKLNIREHLHNSSQSNSFLNQMLLKRVLSAPLQGYQTQHQGAPPQQQPEQQLPQ